MGTAVAGILITFLRIFTKLCFAFDLNGLRNSTLVYFSIGVIFCFSCYVLYTFYLPKLPIIQYYRENTDYSKLQGNFLMRLNIAIFNTR